jgi:hypothetical protein
MIFIKRSINPVMLDGLPEPISPVAPIYITAP